MDKIDCFRYFGIEVTNIRWSWAGLNESGLNRRDTGEGAVAALTIWTDQISWDKEKKCSVWSTYNKNNELWKDDYGNKERIEIIKYCIENLKSEFRPIFVDPYKPGIFDETREAKKHYIKRDKNIWFRISNFDQKTGECEAHSFMKKDQTMESIIKKLDKKKREIKFLQGGATGLKQQKSKNYGPRKIKDEPIYPALKEQIKKIYGKDLVVMIAGGPYGYSAVEEDAHKINKILGHRIHDVAQTRPYDMITHPYNGINGLIKDFEANKIKYVVLGVINDNTKSMAPPSDTKRKIIYSSEKELVDSDQIF